MVADNAVTIEDARPHQAHIEALDQSKKELNRAKSKALDHLSHELRTSLRFRHLCSKPTVPSSSEAPRPLFAEGPRMPSRPGALKSCPFTESPRKYLKKHLASPPQRSNVDSY